MKRFVFVAFVFAFLVGFCAQVSAQTEVYGAAKVPGNNYQRPSGLPTQEKELYYTPHFLEHATTIQKYAQKHGFTQTGLEFDSWLFTLTVGNKWRWVFMPKGTQVWVDSDGDVAYLVICGNPVTGLYQPKPKPVAPAPCVPGAKEKFGDAVVATQADGSKLITQRYFDGCNYTTEVTREVTKVDVRNVEVPCADCSTMRAQFGIASVQGHTSGKQRFLGTFTTTDGLIETGIGAGGSSAANAAIGVDGRNIGILAGVSVGSKWLADVINPDQDEVEIKFSDSSKKPVRIKRGTAAPVTNGVRVTWDGNSVIMVYTITCGGSTKEIECNGNSLKRTTNIVFAIGVPTANRPVEAIKPRPGSPGGPGLPTRPVLSGLSSDYTGRP